MNLANAQPPALITALLKPDSYDHLVVECELIETHISWVILTGTFAYKIKKPVNLGFLDFSTLEKRHFYCKEELRLNSRLAPEIYLAVVPICGTHEQPRLNGEGEAIEFAVKMMQFPQEAQLDRVLARDELQPIQIDEISRLIANFHQQIAVAGADSPYGDLEHIFQPVKENFIQIRERIVEAEYLEPLSDLERWSESTFSSLRSVFKERKNEGYIRECHGDMHLRNLAWYRDALLVFDCVEFNPNLRWIDVISEVAFLVMDLQDHNQPQLAQRFLNAYLEYSGDYAGTAVLPFYLVYRAMIRAKVDAIRARQAGIRKEEQAEAKNNFFDYLQLAQRYIQPAKPQLIITRGMSASGKSTLSQVLLESLGAIRIRSDVERKRLFGMKAMEDAQAAHGEGIYDAETTKITYTRMAELAGLVIEAGYSVIIDATFTKLEQRMQLQRVATEKQVPFVILELFASPEVLRRRIIERKKEVSDADLSVLNHQLAVWDPLMENERSHAIKIDTEIPLELVSLIGQIKNYSELD